MTTRRARNQGHRAKLSFVAVAVVASAGLSLAASMQACVSNSSAPPCASGTCADDGSLAEDTGGPLGVEAGPDTAQSPADSAPTADSAPIDATADTTPPGIDGGADATLPDAAQDAAPDAPIGVDASDGSLPTDGGPDAADDAADTSTTDALAAEDATALGDSGQPDSSDAGAADASYPAVVEADNPLSYWRFGESSGTVATDEMGATNGTYGGTVTFGAPGAIAGDSNTAVTFDGMTAYVDMGSTFAFAGTAAMSYEAWLNPGPGDTAARRFVSKESTNGGRQGYLMAYVAATTPDGGAAGLLSWERWLNGANDAVDTFVSVGVYNHVVVTYDGATMAIYWNGALYSSVPSTRAIATLTDAFRVATYSDFVASADCFPGTIDEVAIYDHALSASRVALHYHVGSGK